MVQKRILDTAVAMDGGSALRSSGGTALTRPQRIPGKNRGCDRLLRWPNSARRNSVWCAQKGWNLSAAMAIPKITPTAPSFRERHGSAVWEGPEQIQRLRLMRMIAGANQATGCSLKNCIGPRSLRRDEWRNNQFVALPARWRIHLRNCGQKPQRPSFVADEFLRIMSDVLTMFCCAKKRLGHMHTNTMARNCWSVVLPRPGLAR